MRRTATPDRRSVLLGAALTTGLVTAGCSGGKEPELKNSPKSAASASASAAASRAASADDALRSRAIAEQKRLLAACAAPAGLQPFASVRAMHVAHLRRLTGTPFTGATAARAPQATAIAAQERSASVALQADCLKASASLAPLLASIAAASEVAAVLLAP